METLNYVRRQNAPAVRRGGVVLLVWGSLQLPTGAGIALYAGLAAVFLVQEPFETWQPAIEVAGLFFLLGIALALRGISTLKAGIELLAGRPAPLRGQIIVTQVVEIIAYLLIAILLMSCIKDRVWMNPQNLKIAVIGFLAYLLFPVALTLTRKILQAAERHLEEKQPAVESAIPPVSEGSS